jgi:hypothetical protein
LRERLHVDLRITAQKRISVSSARRFCIHVSLIGLGNEGMKGGFVESIDRHSALSYKQAALL